MIDGEIPPKHHVGNGDHYKIEQNVEKENLLPFSNYIVLAKLFCMASQIIFSEYKTINKVTNKLVCNQV